MNFTTTQLAKAGVRIRGQVSTRRANAAVVKKVGGFDSKTEAAYDQYLRLRMLAGEIRSYVYHPFTLKLADDSKYTPDFLVWDKDGSITIIEIKGHQYSRDVVRYKWARDKFSMFAWQMVQRRGGEWVVVRS